MRYVLGVDGGGSKVVCLAANEHGELLGYGRGGPVNTNYVLCGEAADSIRHAIGMALNQAGLTGEQVEAMAISAPVDPDTLETVSRLCQISRVIRAAEGETSRWAARGWIDQHVGVTVDAGTGSLARGWAKDGRETGAGGFGATVGDEGSGFWIGLRAIMVVLQAYDGRLERTGLAESLLKRMGVSQVRELPFRVSGGFITVAKMIEAQEAQERIRVITDSGQMIGGETSKGRVQVGARQNEITQGGLFFHRAEHSEPATRYEIASLCPLVVSSAHQGDRIALQILIDAGRELGRLATAVIHRLGMEADEFAIVPFGGVFKAGELIQHSFRKTCLAVAPQASIVQPRFEPEVGAVMIALQEIGVGADGGIARAIERSSLHFPLVRRAGGES